MGTDARFRNMLNEETGSKKMSSRWDKAKLSNEIRLLGETSNLSDADLATDVGRVRERNRRDKISELERRIRLEEAGERSSAPLKATPEEERAQGKKERASNLKKKRSQSEFKSFGEAYKRAKERGDSSERKSYIKKREYQRSQKK